MKRKETTAHSLSKSILTLIKEFNHVRKQAVAPGLFTHNRELLECPECDLVEDVTCEGFLFTYTSQNKNAAESGLRFEEVGEGIFLCPVCRAEEECNG